MMCLIFALTSCGNDEPDVPTPTPTPPVETPDDDKDVDKDNKEENEFKVLDCISVLTKFPGGPSINSIEFDKANYVYNSWLSKSVLKSYNDGIRLFDFTYDFPQSITEHSGSTTINYNLGSVYDRVVSANVEDGSYNERRNYVYDSKIRLIKFVRESNEGIDITFTLSYVDYKL